MKKRIFPYICTAMLVFLLASCAKKTISPQPATSLTVINAVAGNFLLVCNFSDGYTANPSYLGSNFLVYNMYNNGGFQGNVFSLPPGPQTLQLYQFPDTLPKSVPLFKLRFSLQPNTINSLYLTGTVEAPDTVMVTDHIPSYTPADSVTGFRFANLSPGSAPISVNLQGQANGSTVSSIPYKGVTNFQSFPATSAVSSYNFEFRDAATGNLLTTYQAYGINNNGSDPNNPTNNWLYKNSTLALLGLPGNTSAVPQTVLLINNF